MSWFTVKTSTEEEYECLSVILAFGKTPKDLGVPGEEKLVGKGVPYCAVCDAPFSRGKVSGVVGWGDPAIDAVLMLCRINIIRTNKGFVKHTYATMRNFSLLLGSHLTSLLKNMPECFL
jgi:thioredoxin reductase